MTILVAIANDSVSPAVIDTAVRLADGLDEELYVVHLVDEDTADGTAK
jgi:K+-sensing histidine kinase KdpD